MMMLGCTASFIVRLTEVEGCGTWLVLRLGIVQIHTSSEEHLRHGERIYSVLFFGVWLSASHTLLGPSERR